LINDETYWIVENPEGTIVGCGGWSKRKLLFGKSEPSGHVGSDDLLVPGVDAARIRAFFVHPNHIRKGLGTMLLVKCEEEAMTQGFTTLELVATLSGKKLYAAKGYVLVKAYDIELGDGVTNAVISMRKEML